MCATTLAAVRRRPSDVVRRHSSTFGGGGDGIMDAARRLVPVFDFASILFDGFSLYIVALSVINLQIYWLITSQEMSFHVLYHRVN